MGRLGVTIGPAFPHLLYHFVLAYSNWEAPRCVSVSRLEPQPGASERVGELGALPEEHRTDRLSGGSQALKREEFTERYKRC